MKNWIVIIAMALPFAIFGQKNEVLEMQVLRETLPQLIDSNPNSIACYMKGGGMYEMFSETLTTLHMIDSTTDTTRLRKDVDFLSDSIEEVLSKSKIYVHLSDTLFAYQYTPIVTHYEGGGSDTSDLRTPESWQYVKNDLVEVFQTNYEFRGLRIPIGLEFIELVQRHIHSASSSRKIKLNKLNNSHYIFTDSFPDGLSDALKVNAIRVYRPVFNEKMDKACYLFASQVRNGPFREFVFVHKVDDKWIFLDSYNSEIIDNQVVEAWLR